MTVDARPRSNRSTATPGNCSAPLRGTSPGQDGGTGISYRRACEGVLLHEAMHRALITFLSREFHSETSQVSAINCRTGSGNDAASGLRKGESNMINKLL